MLAHADTCAELIFSGNFRMYFLWYYLDNKNSLWYYISGEIDRKWR